MTQLTPRPVADRQPNGLQTPLVPQVDPIGALPILILYPHSRCNCRCTMCDIWQSTTTEQIAHEDIEKWLPELQNLGVERVVLSGGEPLMHTDIVPLCASLHEAGIDITVVTTGLLLPRVAEELVGYVDDIVVSIDGPREIHDEIRNVPRAFERLAAGVAAVRACDPDVRVTGRCTVQRANYRHLRATARAAREMGLLGISFLSADVRTEAFNRPGGWSEQRAGEIALGPDDLPGLTTELAAMEAELADEFESGFIVESAAKLRDRIGQYFAALNGEGDFVPHVCNAPWVSSVIESDGTVRPCFFQPPLGNRFEAGSLDAVLNSAHAIAWRRGLDVERNEICRSCVCSLALRREANEA